MIELINEFFGIENEVSVPIIVSLLVFVTGGIVNFLFEKGKEFKQRSKLRKTFYFIINRTCKDLKIKEQNTFKFCDTLNVHHSSPWNFIQSPISYLDICFDLEFSNTYSAIRRKIFWKVRSKNKADKAFHKIWVILKNLNFVENQIEKNLVEMTDGFNEHLQKYNHSLMSYKKVLDDLLREFDGKKIPTDQAVFMMSQDKIWHEWQGIENSERIKYQVTYNKVIKPILEILRQKQDVKLAKYFDSDLLECEYRYFQMEAILKNYKDQFLSHYYTYRVSRRILEKVIAIIS